MVVDTDGDTNGDVLFVPDTESDGAGVDVDVHVPVPVAVRDDVTLIVLVTDAVTGDTVIVGVMEIVGVVVMDIDGVPGDCVGVMLVVSEILTVGDAVGVMEQPTS